MGYLYTMGLLLLITLVNIISIITAGPILKAPTEYTAFTGPILIQFINLTTPNTVFQVVKMPSGRIIDKFPMPFGYQEGETTVTCGSIDFAGTFVFRIVDTSNIILTETKPCVVRWPVFVLSIPETLDSSSSQVVLKFQIKNDIRCNSNHVNYLFEVVWYRDPKDQSVSEVINQGNVSQFQNLVSNPITLHCKLFDQPGIYQVVFKSSRDIIHPIASSNQMMVTWSKDYGISTQEESIFPCNSGIKVYYTQPRCPGPDDKIRLFKQTEQKREYIAERRAEKKSGVPSVVSFPCDSFDDTVRGYCFVYVSIARNQAVHEQDSKCLPIKYMEAIAVDGGWSEWSEWPTCSQSCEGGLRTRHRKCDNPLREGNGKSCVGEFVETQKCGVECKGPPTLAPKVFTPDPKCLCGCHLAINQGTIVSSPTCKGPSQWTITVPKGNIIKLTFEKYTLKSLNEHTEIIVRDGESSMADLIIRDNGQTPPRFVQSSQNKMWIEFLYPYDVTPDMGDEGFAATFASHKNNLTGVGTDSNIESTIWSSTILGISILLCVVMIIVAFLLFFCYHRHNIRKQKKQQLQLQNQALIVNGEAHTSPSHSASASSIKGSTNISFGDPAGSSPTRKSSKKRDYVLSSKDHHPGSPTRVRDVKNKHKKRSRSPSKRRSRDSGNIEIKDSPIKSNPADGGVSLPSPANYSSPHSKHRQANPSGTTPKSVYSISSHGYMPVSTIGSPGQSPVGTPGATGSPHQRGEMRNKSFISAVKKPSAPPIAGEEDLSPTSPVTDVHPGYMATAHPVTGGQYNREQIPMDSYYNMNNHDQYNNGRQAETSMYSPYAKHKYSPQDIPEKRPPVEGRDSLTRKNQDSTYENVNHPSQHHYLPHTTTPDRQNANYIIHPHLDNTTKGKPEIKPLPLRSIQRPDGQSPDTNTSEVSKNNIGTPNSYVSNDLSPILKNTTLFPESLSKGTSEMDLDLPGENDFEYDDYVPELPGSYFNMDPHAYTLTWSQQPQWVGKRTGKDKQHSGSQQSIGTDVNGSLC